MRVLLGSPISINKAYIIDEWLDYVRSLTWQGLDIYLVDNSRGDRFANYVRSKGFEVDHIEPYGRPELYIAKCQNMIRKRMLEGGYDYLFSLECDNFCVPDIIERLIAHRVDNINVPYFLKEGDSTSLGVQVAQRFYDYQRYDVMPPHMMYEYMNGTLRSGIPSLGCSLYSRRLLELVHFRIEPMQPGKFSDSFFHYDSQRLGIRPNVDTSLISIHKRNPKQWSRIG